MKIGHISANEFWNILKAHGLDISDLSGGAFYEPISTNAVQPTASGAYKMTLRDGDSFLFMNASTYMKTVSMVEKWLNYKLFA